MTNHDTVWMMDKKDVDLVSRAGQWNSFAVKVRGSENPLTWITSTPHEQIDITLTNVYGVYVSAKTNLSDGDVLDIDTCMLFPAQLGCAYLWDGKDFVPDIIIESLAGVDAAMIKITNHTVDLWTFGLTLLDPLSKTQQPICADILLMYQPVTYTPLLTSMYAKVGTSRKASSVLARAGVGSWSELQITELNSTFRYDHDSSKWE